MPLVRPFYAPISSGSMAHTGPVPHANVSYHVISPQRGSIRGSGVNVTRQSPFPQPIIVGQGHLPVSVTPIQFPTAITPALPVNRGQNWFNNPHS